jgi:putative tricarboxylic transport membrane protein
LNAKRLSLIYVAAGILSIWQVTVIPVSPMYAAVGASLVPGIVAVLFTALVLGYGFQSIKGSVPDAALDEDEAALPEGPKRFAYFFGGCLLFVLLIQPLGFLIAGTASALGIARSFDAPIRLKSVVICFLITVSFWVLFDLVLSVDLGPVLGLTTSLIKAPA